ncbi:MAG: hotdog fold thioesterase [Flammeovirgaceae bacterium]|jgi:1,4-dihydroxy-2-naphthoyl-CoA hydrolase|nr:hotdog fold thioesterase [Flammeovirgaceae bacterium]|tara:strand:+ start:2934 stop:3353 length:420 start_codon:yes stop_codon:yes gene_type:complete
MFPSKYTLDQLNIGSKGTIVEHLGIEFIEIGENYLRAKMPVDHRTTQPMGLLHGGASVVLAETLGSLAASLIVDQTVSYPVGLEINANHIKSVKSGFVYGTTSPIHIGKQTQIWQTTIRNEADELVCSSKLTVAIIPKR